jgi:RNA polymerase sigma-70 factor (ECF subfamily)
MDSITFMELTDQELITRYRAGEKEVINTLFSRYLTATYSFLFRLTNDKTVAEEAASEAFLKAWKHLDRFDEQEPFKPWLFKIARNTAYDILRKKKIFVFSQFDGEDGTNSITDTLADPLPLPPELLEKKMLSEELKRALTNLSPPEREILHLYFEENLTFNEIGTLLQEPLDTVKSRQRRALIKLRKLLL